MDRRPHETKSSPPPCTKKEAERATGQEQRTDTTSEERHHDDDGATTTATTSVTSAATPDLEVGREAEEGAGGEETDAPQQQQDNKDQRAKLKLHCIENGTEAAAAVPSSPGSSPVHESHQDDNDNDDVEEMSPVARRTSRPGAVAVPGPFLPTRFAGDDDDDEESPSPPVRPPRAGRLERDGSATTAASSLLLSEPVAAAYAVQDSESDTDDDETNSSSNLHHHNGSSRSLRRDKLEKIRSEILAAAAEAVMVTPPPEQSGRGGGSRKLSARRLRRRRRALVISIAGAAILVVAAAVAVAVAVGVACSKRPHDHDPQPPAPTSAPDSDVVASLAYSEAPEGAFAESIHAEARDGSLFTEAAMAMSGTIERINCVVKPCAAGNGTALCVPSREYVPGCCLGSSCPNETRCGDVCPPPPDSCYLTHPDNVTCTHAECYTCPSNLYELSNFAITVDCLQAGTSVRKSNGQTYKWAIACGPVEQGGRADRDQGNGEYQCAAARVGAGYPGGTDGGALTDPVSCRYLALAECGCGPPGMNSLDLPPPAEACPVNGTACPFRCDPGSTESRLCRAFPGNVTWWEGTNSLDRNWFSTGVVTGTSDSSLRIYLKDGST